MKNTQIERRAAGVIQGKGVRVFKIKAPFFLRIIGRKRIVLDLHAPTLGELVEISEVIASMNLKNGDELLSVSLLDGFSLAVGTAEKAMQCLLIMTRQKVPTMSRERLARYLISRVSPADFAALWGAAITISGVEDFTATIKLITMMNNLSPIEQRS